MDIRNFDEYVKDKNYRNIGFSIISKFKKLTPEEQESCFMLGLWKTVTKFDSKRGVKFSTVLHNYVMWECLMCEKMNKPQVFQQYSQDSASSETSNLDEYVELLPKTLKTVFTQRFINDMSVREICKVNGVSKETIRKKINSALKIIRKFIKNGV